MLLTTETSLQPYNLCFVSLVVCVCFVLFFCFLFFSRQGFSVVALATTNFVHNSFKCTCLEVTEQLGGVGFPSTIEVLETELRLSGLGARHCPSLLSILLIHVLRTFMTYLNFFF